MRKFLGWLSILAWVVLCLSVAGAAENQKKTSPAPKKRASHKASKKSGTGKGVAKTTAPAKAAPKTNSSRKAASKAPSKAVSKAPTKAASKTGAKSAGKKGSKSAKKAAPRTTWRNRQAAPTAERYKEIQDALAAKGFLSQEDATGVWGSNSAAALKKFQAAQNIGSSGKIDSLSLIALGLGPKRDAAVPVKPPQAEAQPEGP
jgi:hypothetical protein